jgi:hypothetical protein
VGKREGKRLFPGKCDALLVAVVYHAATKAMALIAMVTARQQTERDSFRIRPMQNKHSPQRFCSVQSANEFARARVILESTVSIHCHHDSFRRAIDLGSAMWLEPWQWWCPSIATTVSFSAASSTDDGFHESACASLFLHAHTHTHPLCPAIPLRSHYRESTHAGTKNNGRCELATLQLFWWFHVP